MKDGIHPNYVATTIVCACGNTLQSRSTKPSIKLEICSNCHPFFTGNQKLIDSAGRVERFEKRFAKTSGETVKKAAPVSLKAKGQSLHNAALTKAKIMKTEPIKVPVKAGKTFGGFTSKPDSRLGKPPAGSDKAAPAPAPKAK
jgi:large subunit ribosomal protein L31